MRKTRARSLGAGLALALATTACTGPAEISLGGKTAPSTERFLAPTGVDDPSWGTREHPWKTFAFALPKVSAGSTLTLLSGRYDDTTTGTLNVKCVDATSNGAAPDAVLASNGVSGMEIVVKADVERQAFIAGNGGVPPLSLDSCQFWTIHGLHLESKDVDDALTAPDTGSVVVLDGPNQNVRLERLLASHPNRYKHAHVIRIGDGSSDITVEENELYDFHHNAFENLANESSIFFQRNYVNSRGTADLPGGYASEDPTRGDYGVLLEETHDVYVENNVVEGVADGFGVMGRNSGATVTSAPGPLNHNYLRGNVVNAPAVIGFRLDSRCAGGTACDGAHTVLNTDLANDVVIGGDMGISDAGSIGTNIHEVSIIGAARGVALIKEPQNNGVLATSTTANTLVAGFQSTAFAATGEMSWGFDHCAAAGGYTTAADYAPDDPARVTSKVTVVPNLGACLVYLPMSSPLKMAGASANDVGANVLFRYDDRGQLTAMPLWDAATGTFLPCGAPVPGLNDDPTPTDKTANCLTVHTRLHVGLANGCAPP